MTPEVSILLPCFNAATYLSECFASIFCRVSIDSRSSWSMMAPRTTRSVFFLRLQNPTKEFESSRKVIAVLQRRSSPQAERRELRYWPEWMPTHICQPERLAVQTQFLRAHPDVGVVASRVRMFPRDGLSDGLLRTNVG